MQFPNEPFDPTFNEFPVYNFQNLQTIRLRDNKIERIERRAFMNLEDLVHLSLKGNKLSSISDEAFQVR